MTLIIEIDKGLGHSLTIDSDYLKTYSNKLSQESVPQELKVNISISLNVGVNWVCSHRNSNENDHNIG